MPNVPILCRSLAILVVTHLALLLAATAVEATIVRRLGLSEAVALADTVVVGQVVAGVARFDEQNLIVTDWTVAVGLHLGGDAVTGDLTVRLPGGEVGAVGCAVEGVPVFAIGDEVVLFLERNRASATWRPLGLFQGVYRVADAGGQPLAVQWESAGVSIWGEVESPLPAAAYLDELARLVAVADGR